MLVLSRRVNENIIISDNIVVEVLEIRHGTVKIGIQAPKEILIMRGELTGPYAKTCERKEEKK